MSSLFYFQRTKQQANKKIENQLQGFAKAVQEVKAGKIDFKVDKTGIIHAGIGRISFDADKIVDNAHEII